MDLEHLRKNLDNVSESLANGDRRLLDARLSGLTSISPFSEYEYILMFLLDKNAITFEQYEELRQKYVSANQYREVFTLAPDIFREKWTPRHIMELDDRFVKPNRMLDPDYKGQYDLRIGHIRVELRSERAVDKKIRGSLASKAYRFGDIQPFWMNYQQIRLDVADIFIFIGVWLDKFLYWVISNDEVKNSPYLSYQSWGGRELEIGVTDKNPSDFDPYNVEDTDKNPFDFEPYRVEPSEIGNKVLEIGV